MTIEMKYMIRGTYIDGNHVDDDDDNDNDDDDNDDR